jgi:hypothetical protein
VSSIRKKGFFATSDAFLKILMFKIFPRFPSQRPSEELFTWIHDNNYWGSSESLSGSGSSLSYTKNLRAELPALLRKYKITSIFDGPCGDFNWMKDVMSQLDDVTYLGGDIVASLISENNRKYKSETVNFSQVDLTQDQMPKVDLFVCRDLLFHLSYRDARKVLENFLDSGSARILTTTHVKARPKDWLNKDIATGSFRLIDLFSSPFNFPNETLESILDSPPGEPERRMVLLDRDQIVSSLKQFLLS